MAPKCNLCSCLRKVRIISDTFAAIMARYTGVDGGKVVAVKSEDRQIGVKNPVWSSLLNLQSKGS